MTTNEQRTSAELNSETLPDAMREKPSTAGSAEVPNKEARIEEKAKVMDLVGHLTELRSRLIISLLSFAVASVIGWFYATPVLKYLSQSAGRTFVFVAPSEAFFSMIKVSLAIGLVLSSPIVLAELWLFVMPGLLPREIYFFRRYVPFVIALFIVGLVFAHLAVYPIALQFFLGFSTEELQARLAVGKFLNFVLTMHLPFGVIFEIPLVILAMVRAGLLSVEFLVKQRKMAILLAFVIGAILTPPDPVTQCLMAVPMVLLYELSVWLARKVRPVSNEEVEKLVSGGESE